MHTDIRHIVFIQVIFIAIAAALLLFYLRSRGPRTSTYIVAPISATSSLPEYGVPAASSTLVH